MVKMPASLPNSVAGVLMWLNLLKAKSSKIVQINSRRPLSPTVRDVTVEIALKVAMTVMNAEVKEAIVEQDVLLTSATAAAIGTTHRMAMIQTGNNEGLR